MGMLGLVRNIYQSVKNVNNAYNPLGAFDAFIQDQTTPIIDLYMT